MATINRPPSPTDDRMDDSSDPYHIELAEKPQRRAALGMLLTGRPVDSGNTVDQFIQFATQHEFDLSRLWVVREKAGNRLRASLLIVPCPGRTGIVFLSPIHHNRDIEPLTKLIRGAAMQLHPDEFVLTQALLDPPHRMHETALLNAGFEELAVLVYMQRNLDAKRIAQRIGKPFRHDSIRLVGWQDDEATINLFKRAIEASYVDTLDCPGLLGMRDMDDIIAGHKAAGVFRPSWWHVLYEDDQPVGALLLNEVAQQGGLELVYLGLAPEYRGRGLGRQLMEHAFALGVAYEANHMVLAVDESNRYAAKLYRSMGFHITTRKTAFICNIEKLQSSKAP